MTQISTSYLFLVAGTALLVACESGTETVESTTDTQEQNAKTIYYTQGRSISSEMQGILLSNVSSAMQEGGPVHAVSFCNIHALGLTDSISKKYDVIISRISAKNRNPNNAANTDEIELLKSMESNSIKDTVIIGSNNSATYYSTIKTGMPACLKCHGAPETDIAINTMRTIDSLYPDDKAKNYTLGDFRGAWKIEFDQ